MEKNVHTAYLIFKYLIDYKSASQQHPRSIQMMTHLKQSIDLLKSNICKSTCKLRMRLSSELFSLCVVYTINCMVYVVGNTIIISLIIIYTLNH